MMEPNEEIINKFVDYVTKRYNGLEFELIVALYQCLRKKECRNELGEVFKYLEETKDYERTFEKMENIFNKHVWK